MRQLAAIAVAFVLVAAPASARAQHEGMTNAAARAYVLGQRAHIDYLRHRTWHYQDQRHARRSETRYLERNVHALPRLHRLANYWYRRAVTARRALQTYTRARAAAEARRVASAQTASVDSCLSTLINREGGMNPMQWDGGYVGVWDGGTHGGSGAYGIPKALPGSKMASAGADWATNPATQIRWMVGYVNSRYGGSCAALEHSNATGWY